MNPAFLKHALRFSLDQVARFPNPLPGSGESEGIRVVLYDNAGNRIGGGAEPPALTWTASVPTGHWRFNADVSSANFISRTGTVLVSLMAVTENSTIRMNCDLVDTSVGRDPGGYETTRDNPYAFPLSGITQLVPTVYHAALSARVERLEEVLLVRLGLRSVAGGFALSWPSPLPSVAVVEVTSTLPGGWRSIAEVPSNATNIVISRDLLPAAEGFLRLAPKP